MPVIVFGKIPINKFGGVSCRESSMRDSRALKPFSPNRDYLVKRDEKFCSSQNVFLRLVTNLGSFCRKLALRLGTTRLRTDFFLLSSGTR